MLAKVAKYEILEKVGVGGFGTVYKGRDPFIKRLVAIKVCASDEDDVKKRFAREAEFTGNLRHPNITTVYDSGITDDGLPYIVQEFLTGEDLDKVIKRRDPLPLATKVRYLIEVADGLAYAHAANLVHRDIKPSNIRILADGSVKIMDFGIAKSLVSESTLTQTGITLGTASYLAPEQIRGEPVDARTDIFSFGVLAYELLTYTKPFAGEHISTVLYKIMNERPPRPGEVAADVPPPLERIVLRTLEKDRTYRFGSCSELRDELRIIADTLSGPVGGAAAIADAEGETVREPWLVAGVGSRHSAPDRTPEPTGPRRAAPSGSGAVGGPVEPTGSRRSSSPAGSSAAVPRQTAPPPPPVPSGRYPAASPPDRASSPRGQRPSAAEVALRPPAEPRPPAPPPSGQVPAAADEGGNALRVFLASLAVLLAIGGSLGYYFLLGPGASGRKAVPTPVAAPTPAAVPTAAPSPPPATPVPEPTKAPAPTAAPQAKAQATGTATFTSSVYARLKVDGQARGGCPPPVTLTLAAGSHKAVFEVPGFAQITQEFEVRAGEKVPVRAEFPARGQLQVTVRPDAPSAEVRMDGKPLGRLSGGELKQFVPAGSHQVEVTAPGFEPQTRTVTVPEDDRVTLPFELKRR